MPGGGAGSVRLQVVQDSSGQREPGKKSSWPGGLGCAQMEHSVPGPAPPRGRPGRRVSVALAGQRQECRGAGGGEEIPLCMAGVGRCPAPDSSACICRFHEPKADDGCLGPNYMETFSASWGILHLIIMTAFSDT